MNAVPFLSAGGDVSDEHVSPTIGPISAQRWLMQACLGACKSAQNVQMCSDNFVTLQLGLEHIKCESVKVTMVCMLAVCMARAPVPIF